MRVHYHQTARPFPSLFVAVLLLVLSVLPRIDAWYAPPINFLPPFCSSNVTKYGPLVQSIESVSLAVDYCVTIQISEDTYSYNCTLTNNTFFPVPNHQLDPTVNTYVAEIWRFNPEDIWGLTGQITFNFNTSYIPNGEVGVSMAFGALDPTNSSIDIDWFAIDNVWSSVTMDTFFGQFIPIPILNQNPLEESKPVYSYNYLLLAPQVGTYWQYQTLWNESCAIAFNAISDCCMNKQPPLLVFQPYWILLLSTCAYFVASYAYVYLMINLERFACWRRCTKALREYTDIAPIKPPPTTKATIEPSPSESESAAASKAPSALDQPSPRLEPSAEVSPVPEVHSLSSTRARELRDVDDNLRRSFGPEYLTPLIDPSEQPQFVHSASPSPSAVAAATAMTHAANDHCPEEKVASRAESKKIVQVIPAQSSSRKQSLQLQDASETDATAPLTVSERITRANAAYLLLQLLIVFSNFLYIVIRLTVLDHSPTDSSKSTWWRYQQVYMFWTNSSMVTLLASALASHVLIKYQYHKTLQLHRSASDIANEQSTVESKSCRKCYTCGCCCMCCRSRWAKFKLFYRVELPKEKLMCRHIACAVLVVFSPAIITHVIPMWFLFFPFLLLVIVILLLSLAIVFAVFYVTEVSADRAYDNIKEMYANRKKKIEAQLIDDDSDSRALSPSKEVAPMREATADSSSSSTKETVNRIPRVVFPWYSILLLRILFTITIVVLFQTSFNYGQIIYTYLWPYRNEMDFGKDRAMILLLWGEPFYLEYAKRDTNEWYESLQNNMHQFLTQLSLFL